MEELKCIFCNSGSGQIVIEENGYRGKKCPSCDLIYVSPRPALSEIINLYSEDNGVVSAKSHLSSAFSKRLHARQNLSIIRNYKNNGSILEIGAGGGYFLDEAKKIGFQPYGVEPNKKAAAFIKNCLGIPCEEASLSESTFDGKKFDIIYHCNVLSHLYDPVREFKKIYNGLNDDGIVVFETGNIGEMKKKYYRLYDGDFGVPDHLYFFSEKSIKKLLESSGFEPIKIFRYSMLGALIIDNAKCGIKKHMGSGKECRGASSDYESAGQLSANIFGGAIEHSKNAYRVLLFLLRYKLGYLLIKKGHPQQFIVIARKKT